jgi:hypothetical protein
MERLVARHRRQREAEELCFNGGCLNNRLLSCIPYCFTSFVFCFHEVFEVWGGESVMVVVVNCHWDGVYVCYDWRSLMLGHAAATGSPKSVHDLF